MARFLPPFALALALGAARLQAQHAEPAQETRHTPPAPPPEAAPHGTTPASGEPASDPHGAAPASGEHHADPHGTAPAGGEAHAGAHHGPEIRLPFMKQPLGNLGQWLVKLFNFALFAGLLFFALKGILSAAFRARAEELKDLLSQAEREKAESELQMQKLEDRAADLQRELNALLARAERDAESEKRRILDTARLEADQILAQARQEIDYQQRLAEQELRALVASLATEGAALRLQSQLTGGRAAEVLDRSIRQLGGES